MIINELCTLNKDDQTIINIFRNKCMPILLILIAKFDYPSMEMR